MTSTSLFEPYDLGSLPLANRIVMAPLTRNRAGAGFVPGDLAVEYYRQRATAGLIVAEATQISQQGQGYQDTPGIYSDAQIAGWRKVTEVVHAEGGRIFLQLWHVGRVSHVDLQKDGAAPVAPSAIRAQTKTFVNNSFAEVSTPRALDLNEVRRRMRQRRPCAPISSTARPTALSMASGGACFQPPTAVAGCTCRSHICST